MSLQLAFDLPSREAFRRADFFVSAANAQALAQIEGWRDWPDGKLLLIGPEGSGKTHLTHIWSDLAGAEVISAAKLVDTDLHDLAQNPVAVENADRIAGDPEAETALFHLHNLLAGRGLLITAASPARDWRLRLADLLSRMQAASVAQLNAPDDMLLSAVLLKLFADRQIVVAPNLIPYLVSRMDRSIAAACEWVKFLDTRALALGRPITRALAAEVLDLAGVR
ncbi:hypothetical protein GCM10010873_18560 [Cypionkella aquatica]|uniref:Chromosomal replication initiator DnaA n=1 Tax=Cypionkella aquatica TaxID=1756042 RepID=A0AA37X036_9RHOB|nr:chromosomal replication initiator DnaA [Cypionkella aquatica]GLS86882.1 hypothetical protein GCM10010873_18560 [Cypionkella aquatica]